ncbi:hypothetical protein OIU77_018161 [Salix suchowensis]|uniref:Protein FAR1-RELATED SEQUENCE n=1 Tax=Salix suchowensis TaxID=1278906 RepID=A0ABQ8ZRF9_9ROSI|nr:hypothetical protein OIU77_018161 [Salix suchowensis]
MEIDLELPSSDQAKLESRVNTNECIIDSASELRGVDEAASSCLVEEVVETWGLNAIDGGDKVDESGVGVDGVGEGGIFVPQIGLKFETKEAAYAFYRDYALSVGFGITIKASRRSKKNGKFIDVKIACSRFGSKRESSVTVNPRSCTKTNCKAGMHMKRTEDDKWVINNFVKEHNHEICKEDYDNATGRRNKQSGAVACPKKGLQLALDEEDVKVMLEYFMCMQAENPIFFYAIDLDHEKRMRNVFWIDAKGRHDYHSFCDVVFFDTFYVSSKYKLPFVPIIGVNNHSQFLLLGCALIGEHSASSFLWLMHTWLKAVGGQAPKVVITDQEGFLNEAVVDVFPDTRHYYSLWHVLSKIPENLSPVVNQSEIMLKFNKCIYQSQTDEQFEKRWWKMVDKFELREDEWVHSLYENRIKWVPIFIRDISLAGMSTTERSGSIASFFEKYIHREAVFKEFMEQYKAFLDDGYEMEAKAEFETQNKQPALRSLSSFEKQASTLYTEAIFKKFQVEVLGIVSCRLQKESEDEATINFRVDDFEEHQNFLVSWNKSTLDICCICRSFEYRGYLCKHAILVLQVSGVSNIPPHYILKRWTKGAKINHTVDKVSNSLHYRVQRFNDLCKQAIKLGKEASLSKEAYDIAVRTLEEVLENCVGLNNSAKSVIEPNPLDVLGFPGFEEENCNNCLAKSSKKKRTYKKKKVYSEAGGIKTGLQESYQQMDHINSRAHLTDNCYIPQQDTQEELGSRAPNLEGYYGSQEGTQGVGQLNPISPFRDGYYSNQQGLPVLGQLHLIPSHASHYGAPLSMQALVLNLIIFAVLCSSLISLVELPRRINICWNNIFCCRVNWASEHQPCKLLSVICQIWNSLSALHNIMASHQSIYMTSTSPVNSHSNMPMGFQDMKTDK